jgi:predicted Rossmann fold nucleotide-binding protein DprA/Smf involved in DNA uptake
MKQVSPDTQAILLLCGHFGGKATDTVSPLSPKEYERFARWLRDKQARPADLLSGRADELLADVRAAKLDASRIKALLQRGTALALASEKWFRNGLWVISRSDEAYPKRLKKRLGYDAPALLFGAGDTSLLETGGVAIVGSRNASEPALKFTRDVARQCAKEGFTVLSGGARGIDATAMQSASEAGGVIVGVLADSLLRASTHRTNREGLLGGQLVLISPYHPEAGFNAGNAMARNQHIYVLADYALVVQSEQGKGGTWAGATENLREHWVPLLVRESTEAPGNAELLRRGGLKFSFELDAHQSLRQYLSSTLETERMPTSAGLDTAKQEVFSSARVPHSPEPVVSTTGESTQPFAAGQQIEGRAGDTTSESSVLDMFPEFSRRIQSLLAAGPKSEKEIQETMGLEPGQAKAWLKKAEQEHVVVRTDQPVRFALAREGRFV